MLETLYISVPAFLSSSSMFFQNSYFMKKAFSGRTILTKRRALRGVSKGM